jgi:hypothetical protein
MRMLGDPYALSVRLAASEMLNHTSRCCRLRRRTRRELAQSMQLSSLIYLPGTADRVLLIRAPAAAARPRAERGARAATGVGEHARAAGVTSPAREHIVP